MTSSSTATGRTTAQIPTIADLFRWHGSEEVEHRNVAHDVAAYFHNSYPDRIRSMLMAVTMVFVFFQRGTWYLMKADPDIDIGWWKMQWLRAMDSKHRAASDVPKVVWLQHVDVLPARLLAGADGVHGAGGRVPGKFSARRARHIY